MHRMTRRRRRTGAGVRLAVTAALATAGLCAAAGAAQADPLTHMAFGDAATLTWTGAATNDNLGGNLGSAGDVNGDGVTDVFTSAKATNAGIFVLFTPPSVKGTYSIGVNLLPPVRGYKIRLTDGGLVSSVRNAGDQNGDGVPDQLVSVGEQNFWVVYGVKNPTSLPKCTGSSAAATRCLDVGAATSPTNGYAIVNSADVSGTNALNDVADFNGDHVKDFVIGGGLEQVTVLYGGRTGSATPVDLSSLPASEALVIDTPEPAMTFGNLAVTGLQDLNGDGKDEIAITTFAGATLPAAAYIVYGRSGAASPMSTASFGPSDGFRIGTPALSNLAMQSVGDVNGDGRPDLTFFGQSVVTPNAFAGGFVYNPGPGTTDPISMVVFSPNDGYLFKPIDAAPMVQGGELGDLNGDGVPDVVGSNRQYGHGEGNTGFVQVVFGKRPTPAAPFNLGPELTPDKGVALYDSASLRPGSDGLARVGDIDKDGLPDFFSSTAALAVNGITGAGSVQLISGASLVPVADTAAAQRVTDTGAMIGGSVSVPRQGPAKAHLEYGTSIAYGKSTEEVTVPVSDRLVEDIAGLAPSTTYHYRVVASNVLGLTRYGRDRTFTTAATPVKAPDGPPRTGVLCTDYPQACAPREVPKGKAALSLSASPAAKTVKVGKAAAFSVKVGNTGETAAAGVKVCATASSRVTVARKCVTVGALAPGASKKASFSVKGTRKARGHAYKVTFKATGTGLGSKSASAKVSVR
jgi:hypothetical protein